MSRKNLVQNEGFATGANIIKADAQRHRFYSGNTVIDRRNSKQAVQQI